VESTAFAFALVDPMVFILFNCADKIISKQFKNKMYLYEAIKGSDHVSAHCTISWESNFPNLLT
jgi:hypothetical protein